MNDNLNFHAKIAILATCVLGAAASAVTAKAAAIDPSAVTAAAATPAPVLSATVHSDSGLASNHR